MLFHGISSTDVRPGDHLYQWRHLKLSQGIAVPRNNDDASEIFVVTVDRSKTFRLVTLDEFRGWEILRRAHYDQGSSNLHRIKLSGTSFTETRRPANEIVQNARLLLDTVNIKPGSLDKIIANNFAKLCCTVEHNQWCDYLSGNGESLSSMNHFQQESNLASRTSTNEQRVTELEDEIEALKDAQTCPICMERSKDVAFSCGHRTCFQCAQPLVRCHICRRQIEEKIKLFK